MILSCVPKFIQYIFKIMITCLVLNEHEYLPMTAMLLRYNEQSLCSIFVERGCGAVLVCCRNHGEHFHIPHFLRAVQNSGTWRQNILTGIYLDIVTLNSLTFFIVAYHVHEFFICSSMIFCTTKERFIFLQLHFVLQEIAVKSAKYI